jgi:hypothetical protein
VKFNPPKDQQLPVAKVNGHYEFVNLPNGVDKTVDLTRFRVFLGSQSDQSHYVARRRSRELERERDLWLG